MGPNPYWLDFGGIRYYVSNFAPPNKAIILTPAMIQRSAENLQKAINGIRDELITHTPEERSGMQINIQAAIIVDTLEEASLVLVSLHDLAETFKQKSIGGEFTVDMDGEIDPLAESKETDDVVPF